jgi:serine phosphatase RsbU (regulator of sigma subunit)
MFWLGHDDVLVLYTDGVTEARKSKAQFGLDRLTAVVRAAAGAGAASAMSIRDAIASAVDAWADSNDDDISVVVLRHKGSHAH